MIHDQDLVDRLSAFPTSRFEGEVFRATRLAADPTAPSISGGRWAPSPDDPGLYVLYTTLEQQGAIAEVVSFLLQMSPIPRPGPIKVSRLRISIAKAIRLEHKDLSSLGVDMARYGERDYQLTQQIGACIAFLGYDGLIAPSARWPCENVMMFTQNHDLNERLQMVDDKQFEWQAWAQEHGMLKRET